MLTAPVFGQTQQGRTVFTPVQGGLGLTVPALADDLPAQTLATQRRQRDLVGHGVALRLVRGQKGQLAAIGAVARA